MKKHPSQIAGRIREADLEAIEKKVRAGKSLTASERKLVGQIAGETAEEDDTIRQRIDTQAQLAAALNLSKQIINHHAKRPDSPRKNPDGSYNLDAWREFILANGNIQTLARIEAAGEGVATHTDPPACWTTIHFFNDLTAELRGALAAAAKVAKLKLNGEQLDLMALSVWQSTVETLDASLVRQGRERYFLSRDDAEFEDPTPHRAIAEILLRQNARNATRKKSQAAKPKSPASEAQP